MAFRRTKPSSEGDSPSLKQELGSLIGEASTHVRVRGELFAIEAKEAAGIYKRKLALSLTGLICLIIGYLLILGAGVGILGGLFAGVGFSLSNWIGAALILSLVHLILGVLVLKKGRKMSESSPTFEYTLNELKKDQKWIKHEKKP